MVFKVHLKGSIQKQLGRLPFKLFRRAPNPSRATPSESLSECANLPTELYLLIFTYATAKPSFATIGYPSLNPYYSSTFALSRVSRTFRRIALPFLLHTIFLFKAKHVLAFVHALHMQRAYAKQEMSFILTMQLMYTAFGLQTPATSVISIDLSTVLTSASWFQCYWLQSPLRSTMQVCSFLTAAWSMHGTPAPPRI
ncbi:hypothetical protein K503DRAFT_90975 [Rhizopogon vinicolor AM-OR11-026]|uniref:Uncharacterized protein n=1 Tax=Rhizopogon vinicolor AM-OR11-026 TaxID=1314800 RepID=A0A1B7N3F1_9AGAM|nr:hypothetical protein K503DRAFT_90975 [Rhizopogon vinicolor AM-OR11-026]